MRGWFGRGSLRREVRAATRRADAARDAGRYGEAAGHYEAAFALAPGRADLRVQAGHMRKEAGDYAAAERHYRAALALRPDDADLALQLGHFAQTVGRFAEAGQWYARALAHAPGWTEAARERDAMRALAPAPAEADGLVPSLAPGAKPPPAPPPRDQIVLRRLGRERLGRWGLRRTLSGIEAIRGFCITAAPLAEIAVRLGDLLLHHAAPAPPVLVPGGGLKHVFNLWLDFGKVPAGLHAFELRLTGADGLAHFLRERVVVAPPPPESAGPESDALVAALPGDPRPIEEQVRSRPSMIRPATRARFPGGVRSILVLRTDQLGDMVASIPALRRLRELAPAARLVGLVTDANAGLARTLGLFDELIVIDFPDDPAERRRLMPLAAQTELRERLAPYRFDVAVDLAVSDVSRELLLLTGARFLHGFGGREWPWLDGRVAFDTPDARAGVDTAPHSAKMMALVEALGAVLAGPPPVIRRDDLPRALLAPLGLGADDDYILLHAGARLAFSRWPGMLALAERLLAETPFKVVLVPAEDTPAPSPTLAASDRFLPLARALDFDAFDALVSHARVLVGNDSGPKHLAALRGVPVVTLFSARIGWSEWGQEGAGTIISRRVPCAGCAIFHATEECGKDFACVRDIGVEEVLAAVLKLI